MAGREVREYTNLTDPKDRKLGKGKDSRIDDEDITFQRMVSKMQEVAGERGGYLHGRGALDSDDLLYLKEQMEAEDDAERLLRRTEKRAFAAFKMISSCALLRDVEMRPDYGRFATSYECGGNEYQRAASLADSSPASIPLPLRVEPKPKSGIRQQDLLKKVVEVKPKRQKVSIPSDQSPISGELTFSKSEATKEEEHPPSRPSKAEENPVKSLLAAYESSDNEED